MRGSRRPQRPDHRRQPGPRPRDRPPYVDARGRHLHLRPRRGDAGGLQARARPTAPATRPGSRPGGRRLRPGCRSRLAAGAVERFGAPILVQRGVYGQGADRGRRLGRVVPGDRDQTDGLGAARPGAGAAAEGVERGKVVQLSGGGATSPLPGLSAYAASKAAVVRFAETLALELEDDGVDVTAVAPGALNTRMLDEVIAAGPEAVGEQFYAKALEQQRSGGTPLESAPTRVWLVSRPRGSVASCEREMDPGAICQPRDELASDIYTWAIVPAAAVWLGVSSTARCVPARGASTGARAPLTPSPSCAAACLSLSGAVHAVGLGDYRTTLLVWHQACDLRQAPPDPLPSEPDGTRNVYGFYGGPVPGPGGAVSAPSAIPIRSTSLHRWRHERLLRNLVARSSRLVAGCALPAFVVVTSSYC